MTTLLFIAYAIGLTGSILIWFFGLPRRDINRTGHVHLITEQHNESEKTAWRKYNKLSKFGISFIGLSFLLQIISLLLK